MTPLERFIQANEIKPAELASIANVSRQHLYRLRVGRSEPTRAVMLRITRACSWITRQKVHTWDLFDLLP